MRWGQSFFAALPLCEQPPILAISRWALVVVFIIMLAGCGGSGGTPPAPGPPGTPGDHSNDAQLKGFYAFKLDGIGSLQADGNGHITAGVKDFYDSNGNYQSISISGTYNVGSDGRGSITLNSSAGSETIDLLMLSSQHGLLLRFDQLGELPGSIDIQNPAAFSLASLAASSYAFFLSTFPSDIGFFTAGFFNINTSGVITGLEDLLNPPQTVAVSGNIGSVGANGRATAALTTVNGTFNFVLYVVDSTHLMFIRVATGRNNNAFGDAFSRQASFDNTSVSGHLVFFAPFALAAILNADGAGNISGTADIFDFIEASSKPVKVTPVNVVATYSVAGNGRGTLFLTDIVNNVNYSFVIYPCTAGLLMMQTATSSPSFPPAATGVAFQQQAASFSNASINGKFGEIETGRTNFIEPVGFASLGRLVSDGKGNLSGIQDSATPELRGGAPILGASITGTYALDANGHGTATLANNSFMGNNNFIIYAVSSSRVLFISTTVNVSTGFWAQQQ